MDSRLKEIYYSVNQFQKAFKRLTSALEIESELKIDATIQRFEFTFELAWKTLKRALLYEGRICKTPRECLKAGFQLGLVSKENVWLDMLDDRNLMSHIYSEEEANRIFSGIPGYCTVFSELLNELENRYGMDKKSSS